MGQAPQGVVDGGSQRTTSGGNRLRYPTAWPRVMTRWHLDRRARSDAAETAAWTVRRG